MSIQYLRLKPQQSQLLAEGIQNVYGDSYPFASFYDPQAIREQIEAGVLHPVVALDPGVGVVGTMITILEEAGDASADGSTTMVHQDYRGRGVMAGLGQAMMPVYQQLELAGLHLYALGLHHIVQKQSQQAGAVVTGILPAWFFAQATVSGYAATEQRTGAVSMYMPLAGTEPLRSIYLPQAYAEVLQGIYRQLGIPRDFIPEAADLPGQDSRFRLEVELRNRHQRMIVEQLGSDFAGVLESLLASAGEQGAEAVYVDLPLGDAAIDNAVSIAKAAGFVFGALMIERGQGDRLRLQWYREGCCDPADMCLYSAEAETLRDLVVGEMNDVHSR